MKNLFFFTFLIFASSIFAVNKVSVSNGAWNSAATWSPAGVPSLADDVTIQSGHTVKLATTVSKCNSVVIDGILEFDDPIAGRVFSVVGSTTISSNGIFRVNSASNFTNTAFFGGDIVNDGIFDCATDLNSLINISFTSSGTQVISGTGTQFRVRNVLVNKGTAATDLITFSMSNFSSFSSGWLTLQSGSINFSFPNAITSTLSTLSSFSVPSTSVVTFNSGTSNLSLPSLLISGRVILQQGTLNANGIGIGVSNTNGFLTVNGGILNTVGAITPDPTGTFTLNAGTVNCGYQLYVRGITTVNGGTLNIGNASPRGLIHESGDFVVNGGTVNIAGPYTAKVASVDFIMSGGSMNVCTLGNANTEAPFLIQIAGSTFTMSGGTITMVRKAISGNACINFSGLSSSTITGGEIIMGNGTTPASSIMLVQSPVAIPSITVNSTNVDVRPSINSLNVSGNITLNSGILNANSLGISLTGNWVHTGGTFTPGTTTTVTFNGIGQSLGATLGTETFNHLVFSNSGTKTLTSNITARNMTINPGVSFDVSTSNFSTSLIGNWVCNGTLVSRNGTVIFNGTTAQTLSGTGNDFFGLTINNLAGASVTSGTFRITDVLTASNGIFANVGGSIVLVSDASRTARIAPVTGTGDFSGTFIIQRFISSRTASYHDLGSCVTSTTLFDWDDEMYISGINGCDCPAGITGYDGFAGSYYSVYRLSEPRATNDGWLPVKSDTTLTPGLGLEFWFGDGAPGTGIPWSTKTLDTRGAPFKGNLTVNVTNTATASVNRGYNLIANPYPSPITYNLLTRTNVDATFDMYDSGGNYTNFNGTTTIPANQGFYVSVSSTGSGSVQFTESAKNTSSSSNFNRVIAPDEFLIKLSSKSQPLFHEIKMAFDESLTGSFDKGFDALYRSPRISEAPSVVFNVDDKYEITYNFLPKEDELILPLRSKIRFDDTYKIQFSFNSSTFDFKYIYLYDRIENNFFDIKKDSAYYFFSTKGESPDRFILILSNDENYSDKIKNSFGSGFNASNTVEIRNTLEGAFVKFDFDKKMNAKITLQNMLGQNIESFNKEVYNDTFQINKPEIENGFYLLSIEYPGGVISRKVLLGGK